MREKRLFVLIICLVLDYTANGIKYQEVSIGSNNYSELIQNTNHDPFDDVIAYVDSFQTYSFMIINEGHKVCEKYFRNYIRYDLYNSYSMAKSFLSAVLGIAISEGKISLEDRASDYIQTPLAGVGINAETELKVKHLVTMTSGLDWNWHRDYTVMREKDDWLRFLQTLTIKYPPGTKWEYSADPIILSAILEKAVGKPLREYVSEKLLQPIGITDGFYWAMDATGLLLGDGYIYATTENYGRFGQLFLERGKWEGRRVVPEDWVIASTSSGKINPDYGFLWWTTDFEGLPDDLYYAYGGHGQFIVVIPSRDVVIVRTGFGPSDPVKEFLPEMIRKVLYSLDKV